MKKPSQHLHFITGKLAERAVARTVEELNDELGFEYSIDVLPITVAALMTPKWVLRHIQVPHVATKVIVPGYLDQGAEILERELGLPVEAGPRDIRDLPMFFGKKPTRDEGYGQHSIEILAEINHAPSLAIEELIEQAQALASQGADVIDLGCTPGQQWQEVGVAVRELTAHGLRVSIDSFNPWEVEQACKSGAQLVLSVNSNNREQAVDWGCEVVVIPDTPDDEKSFLETINFLADNSIAMRLDPILEPLGCGFTASIERYAKCRREFPEARMMMGIGNVTELTDADSAGLNVLLLAVCEELRIESVLTTQVINWARTSVQECDMARKLVHYACSRGIPPKHLEPDLVCLRDGKVRESDVADFQQLANDIRDNNIRLYASQNEIHAITSGVYVHNEDPFQVMDSLLASKAAPSIDASHAFYLGFEMAKALTANTLGKNYMQDEALNWGYLTREENHHRLARTHRAKPAEQGNDVETDSE